MFFHLSVNSQFLTGSESPTNFDDSTEAAGLVSDLVSAATIPLVITTVLLIIVLCLHPSENEDAEQHSSSKVWHSPISTYQ